MRSFFSIRRIPRDRRTLGAAGAALAAVGVAVSTLAAAGGVASAGAVSDLDSSGAPGGAAVVAGPNSPAVSCPAGATCDWTGAFQSDMAVDYETAQPGAGDYAYEIYSRNVLLGGLIIKGQDAGGFFAHYLDGSGSDLDFDASGPYGASPAFRSAVDGTVKQQISQAGQGGQPTFDSGYLDFTFTAADNADWAYAMQHGYYRVAGTRNSDGTWAVRLWLTSLYQFRPGVDFPMNIAGQKVVIAQGTPLRRLEQTGLAKDFREVGNATLTYDQGGNSTN